MMVFTSKIYNLIQSWTSRRSASVTDEASILESDRKRGLFGPPSQLCGTEGLIAL